MKIINVLEHRLSEERRVLKKMEGTGAKGANGTKKEDVQKYTASVQQIGQGRERVEGGWDKGQ